MRQSSSMAGRPERVAGRPAAALGSSGFRWLLISHGFGSLGLWTHRTALVWFTAVVTDGDAPSIGLVTALQYAPMWLSAFGGGLGDRWRKRTVLLVNQLFALTACLALGIMATSREPGVVVLGSFAALLGLSAAVEAPIRLAYPREIVEAHLVRGAIGLSGLVFQCARVVGPAVAGIGIAAFSESVGFAFAALCALSSSLALLVVRALPAAGTGAAQGDPWRRTLRRIWRNPQLMRPLAGAAIVGTCLANLQVWLPLVVDDRGGASDYGILLAAIGAGGAVGALVVSALPAAPSSRIVGALLVVQTIVIGLAAVIPVSSLLVGWVFLAGLVMQTYNTSAITAFQDATPEGAHGRLMGLYVVSYFIWAGAGTPLFGLLAAAAGPRVALGAACAVCLMVSLLLNWWSGGKRVRRE